MVPVKRFSAKMQAQMRLHNLTYRDVSEFLGLHYEHIRKLANGYALPSRVTLQKLAEILQVRMAELEKLVVADRIEMKFGKIPFQLIGSHPELGPLESLWRQLTKPQKEMVKMQIEAFAQFNRSRYLP